jgi:hypothetical protein
MNRLLAFAAALEAATGLALLVKPALLIGLLFGVEVTGAGVVMSRFAGIGLIGMGVACWPAGQTGRAICGMLAYNALAAAYLVFLGLDGKWAGPLLWPAAGLHSVLAALFAAVWIKTRKSPGPKSGP